MTDESSEGHWVLCVAFSIKPQHVDEFVRICSEVIELMRLEPNFVTTFLCRDPADETRFFLFETWKSRADFIAVDMSRDYRKPYEARLAEIQLGPREVREWRQVRADYRLAEGPAWPLQLMGG